jgi:hypothetical protein
MPEAAILLWLPKKPKPCGCFVPPRGGYGFAPLPKRPPPDEDGFAFGFDPYPKSEFDY